MDPHPVVAEDLGKPRKPEMILWRPKRGLHRRADGRIAIPAIPANGADDGPRHFPPAQRGKQSEKQGAEEGESVFDGQHCGLIYEGMTVNMHSRS